MRKGVCFMAKTITTEEFEAEVLKCDLPVVVDFFTQWCGPCKMMVPVLEKCDIKMRGKAKVFKVDAEQEPILQQRYKIATVPTLVFFENGVEVDVINGVVSEEAICNKLENLYKKRVGLNKK